GNVEIALDALETDGKPVVRFMVTDTGPGIPGEMLESIFQPFTKADDSYSTRRSGAGVGLSVAKRLIESIGGTIGVESEPGMGASFFIMVPITQNQVVDPGAEVERTAPPSGLTLLALVPPATREKLEPLLTPFGNRIMFTDRVVQASAMSARGGFDMIIATAASVDLLAAAPGRTAPVLS